MNEGTLISGQAIQLRLITGRDAGQEEILVPGPKGFADHGPDIDAAAGGFRALAEGVEDTHNFDQKPILIINGPSSFRVGDPNI